MICCCALEREIDQLVDVARLMTQRPHPLQPDCFEHNLLFATVEILGIQKPNEDSNDEAAAVAAQGGHGKPSTVGTGFFYIWERRNYLVTARHVLELVVDDNIHVKVHEQLPDGRPAADQQILILRPSNSAKVPATGEDIAVLDMAEAVVKVSSTQPGEQPPQPYIQSIPDGWILDNALLLKELGVVHSVCMFSYPVDQFDEEHQLPLIRTGMTCTTPGLDCRGRPEGYTDISAHRGDSGSPVIVLEKGMYVTKSGTSVGSRYIFLGVHKGGLDAVECNRPELELTTGCYVKATVLRGISSFVPFPQRPAYL